MTVLEQTETVPILSTNGTKTINNLLFVAITGKNYQLNQKVVK